jgi:predicted permease
MLRRLRAVTATFLQRSRFEDAMRDEMQFHLEARTADLVQSGLSPREAARRARMEFGSLDTIKDDCRASRGLRLFDEVSQDVRYASRLMRRTPGFTVAAVLSLALGIGANAAIFSLVDAVMLRTLALATPHELFFLAHGAGEHPSTSSNYPLFERYAALTDVFSGVTAYSMTVVKVPAGEGIENVDAMWVSGNFHGLLGVPIALGRGFAAEPDRLAGGSPIAVISDSFWRRRFGRSPDVLGQTLTVDGRAVSVVGVTAPEFWGMVPGQRPDITLPLSLRAVGQPDFLEMHDTWTSMPIMARLKPGVPHAQALAAADVAFRQYMSEPDNQWITRRDPDSFREARLMSAARGSAALRQRYETPLAVLMSMVGLILLIASANVANLMLVRGEARAKEVAIRLCVGGGRRRLIRQFLTESVLLALCGAAVGFVLAQWATSAIMAFFDTLEVPVLLDVGPSGRVMAFTFAISLLSALLFGIVPALKSTGLDLTPALKEGDGRVASARRWTTGHALVASQLALGVLVIVVAGLLVRSLHNLQTLDAGFRGDRVLLFTIDSSGTGMTSDQRRAMYAQVLDRLRTLPGVTLVAASRSTPVHTSGNARALHVPGLPETPEARAAFTNMVTPGYFDTFGIRLLRGRDFTDRDMRGARKVAVINETMARFYFGDRDPLEETFAYQSAPEDRYTVVGITQDTHQMNLRELPPRMVYTPLAQEEQAPTTMNFEMRAAQNPATLIAAARDAALPVSKGAVLRYVRTMEQQVNASLVRERLLATLSTGFAVLALTLTTVGLYGVMSYNVIRRRREIGIRMALGARRSGVLWQILRQTLIVSLAGIALGVVAALVATRLVSTLLFEVSSRDPLTLGAVATLLLTTALAAGFFPARRAATLDPVRAIRTE